MITGRQIRAARGLLKWRVEDLSDRAGLSREAISRIEDDAVKPREGTIAEIVRVFSENGIEFIDNQGVRMKPQNVEVLEGTQGFLRFYDSVYNHLNEFGGLVCVSGVIEKLFVKYQGDFSKTHMDRMAELVKKREDLMMRILVEEGDYNFVASRYAEYRWQAKEFFSPAPFYVFGDNLALISFSHEPSPLVILIKSASLAEAYRNSFSFAWQHAIVPADKNNKDDLR